MGTQVQLRRHDTSTPWGFRMNGGLEFGQPLHIQKVVPNSLSYKAGLCVGDVLLQIGDSPTHGMTHEQAKMEIIRAGNEVNFFVKRESSRPSEGVPPPPLATPTSPQPRAEVVRESAWGSGGPVQNPAMQSRSFKMLQHQMAAE